MPDEQLSPPQRITRCVKLVALHPHPPGIGRPIKNPNHPNHDGADELRGRTSIQADGLSGPHSTAPGSLARHRNVPITTPTTTIITTSAATSFCLVVGGSGSLGTTGTPSPSGSGGDPCGSRLPCSGGLLSSAITASSARPARTEERPGQDGRCSTPAPDPQPASWQRRWAEGQDAATGPNIEGTPSMGSRLAGHPIRGIPCRGLVHRLSQSCRSPLWLRLPASARMPCSFTGVS